MRPLADTYDPKAAALRCLNFRKRILEISQQVGALHIGSAFSCAEIVECIYYGLMRYSGEVNTLVDTFIMSKGHGCMIQYVILEAMGILSKTDMEEYCTPHGRLGCHPDYGNPGIEASTGSLGHGLPMAVGMAIAEKRKKDPGIIYAVLSDGEIQEGSTWEAIMMASSLEINNLVVFIDNNDFQSLGRTSETHPSFYPVDQKLSAFGWETVEIPGHDSLNIYRTIDARSGKKPMAAICKTTKGKGISFMENVPIWHYRSPNTKEYEIALDELRAAHPGVDF